MNTFMILLFSTLSVATAAGGETTAVIPNFHKVNEGLYRGGRPDREAFVGLEDLGVRTILDLERTLCDPEPDSVKTERTWAAESGMRFEHIPMHPISAPEEADVERVLSLITDPSAQPIYVHCHRGSDRTGIVMAAYRIRYEGWTVQEALEEMKRYGYRSVVLFWWKNLLYSF